jgi:hypothetical protein
MFKEERQQRSVAMDYMGGPRWLPVEGMGQWHQATEETEGCMEERPVVLHQRKST